MSATAHKESPTAHPVTLIRAAVLWCRASGIPVRLGTAGTNWGVRCTGAPSPRWAEDPRHPGVTPLGAAILNYQPEAGDPHAAVAECLFAPDAWIRAFEAGLTHEEIPEAWLTATDHRLRIAAYEAGIHYREEFIRVRPAAVLS